MSRERDVLVLHQSADVFGRMRWSAGALLVSQDDPLARVTIIHWRAFQVIEADWSWERTLWGAPAEGKTKRSLPSDRSHDLAWSICNNPQWSPIPDKRTAQQTALCSSRLAPSLVRISSASSIHAIGKGSAQRAHPVTPSAKIWLVGTCQREIRNSQPRFDTSRPPDGFELSIMPIVTTRIRRKLPR